MMQEGEDIPGKIDKNEVSETLFNFEESFKGIADLAEKPVVKIEQGIVAMDQGFRSLVNQMGAGENMSEAIRKNLAGATLETIKMGGKADSALQVQLETLKQLGKNVTLSQELTTELFAASQVSGQGVDKLESGFLNAGMSLKDIGKEMLVVRDVANSLGVNAKLVSEKVVGNLDKLNRFGFQGGVEGLARMAAKATALRVSMDSTFNLAEGLMSPERAIELSAALQRLGASTSDLTDPLKLMDLAQNNVPELQKQLGEMFKTYTFFDEKTKTFQIMPSAKRQLREIANELQMDIGEVERMALGTADLDKKLSEISFSGFDVDQDTKELVANMATMDESGEYKIQTEEIGDDGKPISKTIQEVMDQFKGDDKGLKEYLTGLQEDKEPKTIEQIAQSQLDVLTDIKKANEALAAAPGLLVGASKVGPALLSSVQTVNKAINEPLEKQLGPENNVLSQTFDNLATEISKATDSLIAATKTEDKTDDKTAVQAALNSIKDAGKTIGGEVLKGFGGVIENFGGLVGVDTEKFKKNLESKLAEFGVKVTETKEKAEEKIGEIKDKITGETEEQKGEEFTFPDEMKFEFPDSVNTQEIKASSLTIEKPITEEKNEFVFPDDIESQTIKTGKIVVEEGINLTAPAPTPTITTPEVKGAPEVKGTKDEGMVEPFTMEVGPALADIGGLEGLDLTQFKPIAEVLNQAQQTENVGELPPVETIEELPLLNEVAGKPEEDKKGFLEKFNNFVQELKTQTIEKAPEETEEPKLDLLKGFEKISEIKLPELNLFKKPELGKTEEPKLDIVKGFEDSSKKISDLKIGGLEKEPKIELGKSEETTEKKLFDFKPSILGKFISEGKVETEEKPEEEKKGRFSKIKDAFVKSFIEPKAEEQTFVLPEEEYTPNEIGAEEGIGNLDKTATELGIKQEELTNIALQQDQPETTEPITELKLDTSEVETLNVKNLNIGDSLTELLTAGKKTEGEETNFDKIQKLIQEGLVGEAIAGPAVPTPTATPIETPTIDAQVGLPELTEELPQTLPTGKTRGIFKKTEQTEEPSAYEGYKKLLEEISGAEIVGQGKEAFFLTDEMKAQAKKDSELIGPEKQEPKFVTPPIPKTEVETPESLIEGETAIRSSLAFKSGNLKELEEKFPDASKKIRKEAAFSKAPGEKFELPKLTKEEEEIMMEGDILTKPYDKLEEKYYDMKATQSRREAEKFEKEKLVDGKTLSKEDEDTLQSIRKRATEYANKSYEIEEGEVESFDTKIETKGLIEDKGLAPIKPTLASLPIPEKEEKQPLGERIKEGIGGLKEKLKGKQEEEKPIAAVPETQEEYVVKDKEGNIIGTSSTERTARLKGESKTKSTESMGGFTVEKQTVSPKPPETSAVGVEQAAAEAEKPKTLRERIEQGADKLSGGIEKFAGKIGEKFEGSKIKSKIDETRSKIKPQEEPSKIEPIQPEPKEERPQILSGKEKEDVEKFLYSKNPFTGENLKYDEKTVEHYKEKGIEIPEEYREGGKETKNIDKGEKTPTFGLDMSVFNQKLPAPPKPSLEVEETKFETPSKENIFEDEEDFGPVDPVSEFAEDGTIKPFSGKPEEIKEPEETEIQKTIREAREKQLAFLEELRLKEQTPQVPAKGIEKLFGFGQKFAGNIGGFEDIAGLFGFGEEATVAAPEINYEEEMSDVGIDTGELGLKNTEDTYDMGTVEEGFDVGTLDTTQEGIPEDLSQIAVPGPIEAQQSGGTEPGARDGKKSEEPKGLTVEGGSPIVVEVKHTFQGLPSGIDTAQLEKILKDNNGVQQAVVYALEKSGLGLV